MTSNGFSSAIPQPPAPAAPRNPLAGTPLGDWVRDGAAFLLLLLSLTLPWGLPLSLDGWDGNSATVSAAGRVEVVLVTLLSVLTLSLTYLARFGALGPSVTLRGVLLARLLLNAPYAILVLVFLLLDAFGVGPYEGSGIGAAAMLGLAGALLAAQPREFEVRGESFGGPVARLWRSITIGFLVVILLFALVGLVKTITVTTQYIGYIDNGALVLLLAVVILLIQAAVIALPLILIIRGSDVARTVALGASSSALVGVLLTVWFVSEAARATVGLERFSSGGYFFLWIGVILGLAASPGVRLSTRPLAPVSRWLNVIGAALIVLVVGCGVLVVSLILGLFTGGEPGLLIGELLCVLLIAVGALIGRSQFVASPSNGRPILLTILGGAVVLGIVSVVLAFVGFNAAVESAASALLGGSGSVGTMVDPTFTLTIGLGFPLLIAAAVLLPKSLRDALGPLRFGGMVSTGEAGYPVAGAYPAAPAPAVPAPEIPLPPAAPESLAPPAPSAGDRVPPPAAGNDVPPPPPA